MPTVLVTGASRGIGAAIARTLAERGHHVAVNYRTDAEAAAAVVDAINANGGCASAYQADVTDPVQVDAMLAAVHAEHGQLDAVVLNANTVHPPFKPLADLRWETFADKLLGELAGAFHVVTKVLPGMRERRAGRLMFIGSTAADYVGGGRLAHGTAKAALATFARHVAAECARDGVSVLTIAPGAVRTPPVARMLDDASAARLAEQSVVGRMLEPVDVAGAVAVLLDPALHPATGSTVRLDGGWSVLVGGPHA